MPRYAAIDIGSNSIRMQAAETGDGMATKILAAERQVTHLGAGVFQDGRITADERSAAGAARAGKKRR